jgi:hypothetical protein
MVIDFNTFTRYFFYLFVCYQYANYHYPPKTQEAVLFICYNSIYLYSKLQIFVNKKLKEGNNYLIKYEEYKNLLNFLYKMKEYFDVLKEWVLSYTSSKQITNHKIDKVTLDFVLNNEIIFTFQKSEFLNDYLADYFPNKKENSHTTDNSDNTDEINESESTHDEIIDYDFVIINCDDNLKKIIKYNDLVKRNFETEDSTTFHAEPFLYKPLLCEFSNQLDDNDNDPNYDKPIKIDFCDNNQFYDFLVVGNCFDKGFLTYFMKKYYDVDVKEKYVLKIIDNNVNTFIIESSDTLTILENSLVVDYKK